MIENNIENRQILADRIIGGMDFDAMINCIGEYLTESFKNDNQNFQDTWKVEFDPEDDCV